MNWLLIERLGKILIFTWLNGAWKASERSQALICSYLKTKYLWLHYRLEEIVIIKTNQNLSTPAKSKMTKYVSHNVIPCILYVPCYDVVSWPWLSTRYSPRCSLTSLPHQDRAQNKIKSLWVEKMTGRSLTNYYLRQNTSIFGKINLIHWQLKIEQDSKKQDQN